MLNDISTMDKNKDATYKEEARRTLVANFRKSIISLYAPYRVSLELAKAKKPFTEGSLGEKCGMEMAKAFGDAKMAEKFESLQFPTKLYREVSLTWENT